MKSLLTFLWQFSVHEPNRVSNTKMINYLVNHEFNMVVH